MDGLLVDKKEYEKLCSDLKHSNWVRDETLQTAKNRLEEVHRLREDIKGLKQQVFDLKAKAEGCEGRIGVQGKLISELEEWKAKEQQAMISMAAKLLEAGYKGEGIPDGIDWLIHRIKEQDIWIGTTKNHAPYEAAGATWQVRHDKDQENIKELEARIDGAMRGARAGSLKDKRDFIDITCNRIKNYFDRHGLHDEGLLQDLQAEVRKENDS